MPVNRLGNHVLVDSNCCKPTRKLRKTISKKGRLRCDIVNCPLLPPDYVQIGGKHLIAATSKPGLSSSCLRQLLNVHSPQQIQVLSTVTLVATHLNLCKQTKSSATDNTWLHKQHYAKPSCAPHNLRSLVSPGSMPRRLTCRSVHIHAYV